MSRRMSAVEKRGLEALALMRHARGAADLAGAQWCAGLASFPHKVGLRLVQDDLVTVVRLNGYGTPNRIELNLRGHDYLAAMAGQIGGDA